ncbi:protein YCF54, chloroplastic [Silene latifolia]|uniref:protein YCF54, chloroplastic n=1 Tax=Silene latifolia TaxID=37657 RepID=UPI003D77CE79
MVVLASSVCMASQLTHFHNPPKLLLPTFTPTTRTSSSSSISRINPQFLSVSSQSITPFTISAVAADTSLPSSSPDKDQTTQRYYFVVANAKFMLDEEEHFKELMFERLRLFQERKMEQDFWLVVEPKFLDKFPNITKRLKRPAVALVSTNRPWITYMKLRLDRVLLESYEADSVEEALASNPVKLEFEKPENWVAPYQKYESGWWESFLPPASQKPQA